MCFCFQVRTNKRLFLLEILLLPPNPFNCRREEQNCLAERQLSLVLCWYFLLKWCFRSCLTVWLHHLMSCITCSLSGLPLPLFTFSDCPGCSDFSGEDSSRFNSCWCRKDRSPWIRMRYYFYDLFGASQLLGRLQITKAHSFFLRWLLISLPSMSASVLDFSAGHVSPPGPSQEGYWWATESHWLPETKII